MDDHSLPALVNAIRKEARKAKALVALAFRNAPIEDVHAEKNWSTCPGDPSFLTSLKAKCVGS
jgi:hypothetical protein